MHQLETLLFVFHENQWEDTLIQGSPELFSPLSQEKSSGVEIAMIYIVITFIALN